MRQVRETGEAIEILLRDETVAYLSPAITGRAAQTVEAVKKQRALEQAFAGTGLTCKLSEVSGELPRPNPVTAGDGLRDVNSASLIRGQKDW